MSNICFYVPLRNSLKHNTNNNCCTTEIQRNSASVDKNLRKALLTPFCLQSFILVQSHAQGCLSLLNVTTSEQSLTAQQCHHSQVSASWQHGSIWQPRGKLLLKDRGSREQISCLRWLVEFLTSPPLD